MDLARILGGDYGNVDRRFGAVKIIRTSMSLHGYRVLWPLACKLIHSVAIKSYVTQARSKRSCARYLSRRRASRRVAAVNAIYHHTADKDKGIRYDRYLRCTADSPFPSCIANFSTRNRPSAKSVLYRATVSHETVAKLSNMVSADENSVYMLSGGCSRSVANEKATTDLDESL